MLSGDFNLILLDQIIENKAIQMIGCCNEVSWPGSHRTMRLT